MRRAEREVTRRDEIDTIIRQSDVCHLAFIDGLYPYVIPISFGYDGRSLYVHTAGEGKKLDCIAENDRVCFQFDCDVYLKRLSEAGCDWTFAYQSVIGFGRIRELTEKQDKILALDAIMTQYVRSKESFTYRDSSIEKTRTWAIDIESLTGKRST